MDGREATLEKPSDRMLEATLLGRRRVYEAVTMSDAAAAVPAVHLEAVQLR
jgi:hypothetical protein